MQFTSEQAYDMLPYAVEIYDKLEMTEYVKNVRKENKDITTIEAAEKAIKYIVKNTPKFKKEFFGIVGIAQGISLEEAKQQSPVKTMKTFKEIYKDKELVDFFKSAIE